MTWYSRLPNIVNLFIIFPLIIKYFSINEVALYYLFNSLLKLQDVADFGFSLNYSRFISYAYAGAIDFSDEEINKSRSKTKKNWLLINKVYYNMFFTYLMLAILFTLTFGIWTSIQVWPKIKDDNLLVFLWLLFQLAIFLKIRYKYLETFIMGVDKVAKLREIIGNFSLFQSLLIFIVLLITKDFIYVIIINIIFLLLINIRNYFLKKHILAIEKVELVDTNFDKEINDKVLPLSIKAGIGNLVTLGLYHSVGFIFVNSLSSPLLAMMLLSNRFLDFIKDFSRAPFYSRIPYFSMLFIKNKIKMIKKVERAMIFSLLVFMVGSFSVYFFSTPILNIINPDFPEFNRMYWLLLCFAFFIERYSSMHIQFYALSNKIHYHWINILVSGTIIVFIFLFGTNLLLTYPKALLIAFIGIYFWLSIYFSSKKFKLKILRLDLIIFLFICIIFCLLIYTQYVKVN